MYTAQCVFLILMNTLSDITHHIGIPLPPCFLISSGVGRDDFLKLMQHSEIPGPERCVHVHAYMFYMQYMYNVCSVQ